jgi:hypothetical protein
MENQIELGNIFNCFVSFQETVMKVDKITFFPHRKEVGIIGLCFFAVSILLCYRFFETRHVLYVLLALVTVVISIYLLGPFFRNPVVDIIDDAIILHSFWKKHELASENFYGIVHHKDGGISYQFSKGKGLFHVTPKGYYDGDDMQIIFNKIFGNKKSMRGKQKMRTR